MPKIVIKNIAVAIFITLNILGGTAWGMWEELDTNTQRRILTAHVEAVSPLPVETSALQRRMRGLAQISHTGGWLDNWPNITLETTCANCRQEILKEYQTVVELRSIAARNNQFLELQRQNDLLQQQIALLSQNRTPQ